MPRRDEKLPSVRRELADDFVALANPPEVASSLVESLLGLRVDLLGILVHRVQRG